ncbi:MAG: hypothetical protein ABIR32_13730 [Ilumatobacteraceae bacterium]
MQFLKASVAGIVDGSITLTFRGWTRAQAKVGGRYRTFGQLIEVDDIRLVDAAEITDAEANLAGDAHASTIVKRLGDAAAQPIWRIQFHHVGDDDRIERRNDAALDDDRRAAIQARLDRFDKASKTGAWTTKTLRLIATYPGVVSTALARQLNADRPAFKINVRKLKELGLTQSLEVGYRLSPLGEAFTGLANASEPAVIADGDHVAADAPTVAE